MKKGSKKTVHWYLEQLLEENYDAVLSDESIDTSGASAIQSIRALARELKLLSETIGEAAAGRLAVAPYPHVPKQGSLSANVSDLINAFIEKERSSQELRKAFEIEKEKLVEDDWIKSQYAKIFSNLQGVKTLNEFGDIFVSELAHSVQAQVGTLYVKSYLGDQAPEKDSVDCLIPAGLYGLNRESVPKQIKIGEGLIGQCAKDMKPAVLTENLSGFVRIFSSVGASAPKALVVFPIIHEGKCYAVFELALLGPIREAQMKLIEQVAGNIGVSILNISQNMLTKRLYDEIAEKNYSLDTQKRALDVSAIVAETDPHGRITYVNDKFLEISQYSREELIGQDHRILNSGHHPREFFIVLWKTIARGNMWKGEVKNRAKDGSFYWVDTTIYPVKSEDGKLKKYVAIRFDITDKKNAQAKLEEASLEAQRAVEAKSLFLANMSHEIRTPMNGIIGMAALLEEDIQSAQGTERLATIVSCGNSLLTLINDILDFSKIEAGKIEIKTQNFDIKKTIHDKVTLFNVVANEKRLKLTSIVDPSVPTWVLGDETKLRQVLNNLLNNAIKFTEMGGVELRVTSRELGMNEGLELCFEVIDSGIGIARENLNKLFKNFSQVDGSTTRSFGGTGLGLSISKSLVRLMGGDIEVISDPGRGTTFRFTIRCRRGMERSDSRQLVSASHLPESDLASVAILVVEDNAINRKVVKGFIERFGANADFATNGREALEMVGRKNYDLVLMDCHMPEMDGFEATGKIIEQFGNNRPMICALTASAMKEDVDKCIESGMDTFLAKPLSALDLSRVIFKAKRYRDDQGRRLRKAA